MAKFDDTKLETSADMDAYLLRTLKRRNVYHPVYGVRSTLKWDREWGEFVITTTCSIGCAPVSTYHTTDPADAVDTQVSIYNRYVEDAARMWRNS